MSDRLACEDDRVMPELVYQGGLHDVWCDGTRHVKTEGGYTQAKVPFEKKARPVGSSPCNCSAWVAWREGGGPNPLFGT